jgi:hypothetical protein
MLEGMQRSRIDLRGVEQDLALEDQSSHDHMLVVAVANTIAT